MTVHQYSAGKTVVTMFLTLIVMGIIVFLGTLVLSMMRDLRSLSTFTERSYSGNRGGRRP